ncbi:MAG: phospholipase D-like domain-containing protein [Acidithiobacillus sp.]
MSQTDYITQPSSRTTLDALQSILQNGGVERLDIAVAYVTNSGAHDLVQGAFNTLGGDWASIPKRWITSFDYCRTEPIALECLLSLPNSSVRIHDAAFCLEHDGAPKVPFHPKAFLIRTNQRNYALVGSGNMSRSGLTRGVEAGLVVSEGRIPPVESTAAAAMQAMRLWFSRTWRASTPLTAPLLTSYSQLFEHKDNLKAPIPTEDDVASTDTGRGALSTKDLQRLRVCRHFWIDAGNITRNRGPHLPGNQLMMKRLSRVFFGFSSTAVSENTHIGDLEISFNGGQGARFSLTYSDNQMDKLVLPIPDAGGPPAYDNMYLLFERTMPGAFKLTIGTRSQKAQWLRRSTTIDGAFRMSSGREWGVF